MTMFHAAGLDVPETDTVLVSGAEVGVIDVAGSPRSVLIVQGRVVEKGTPTCAAGFT